MSSVGGKVTKDPAARDDPVTEPTGLVTSDSLAAESINTGGSFAANDPHRGVSKQPSKSTTSNITDTSAARELPPAIDSEARQTQEEWDEQAILNRSREERHTISSKRETESAEYTDANDYSRTGFEGAQYEGGSVKPLGKDLKEDPNLDGKNFSGTTDIGGKNDPGRLGELNFQKKNAKTPGTAGTGIGERYVDDDDRYGVLGEQEAPAVGAPAK